MTDPREPFGGIPPVLYHRPKRDMRRTARAFALAVIGGAALWSVIVWTAFGSVVPQDGPTPCASVTAPSDAPMPPKRGGH